MREITVYETFDGVEFDTREECVEYEQNCYNAFMAMKNAYIFYDETGKVMSIRARKLETLIDKLDSAYLDAAAVQVIKNLSQKEIDIVVEHLGRYDFFEMPAGFYKYDDNLDTWKRVSK